MNTNDSRKPLTAKGTIQRKTNGKGKVYYQLIRFPLRYKEDGTIEYVSSPCYSNRDQAVQYQQELIKKREQNQRRNKKKGSKETVYDALKEFAEAFVYPNYRNEDTRAEMDRLIEKYVKPELGNLELKRCREIDLQRFFNHVNQHRNPYKLFNIMKRMYTRLERNNVIAPSPMKYLKCPRHQAAKQNRDPLFAEDVQKIFKYLNENFGKDRLATRYRHVIEILFYTGMRPGELCGLERMNITPEGDILIRKTVGGYGEKDKVIRDYTKTENGQRIVSVKPCIEHMQEFFEISPDSPWVVPQLYDPSKPCRPVAITSALKRIGEKCGIERSLFAYLGRHTFITEAVKQNIPPNQLRYLTGHADANMINRIYANHKDPRVIQKFDNTISHLYD